MKFNFGRLLDNRRLLMILSLVTSVIIWLVIVYYVEPDKVQTIRNVPVTITAVSYTHLTLPTIYSV